MSTSLLLSLLLHGLLLSLTFGGQGLGLPGLGFPWQERRVEAPELRLVLVLAPVTRAVAAVNSVAGPAQQASIEPPVAEGRAPTPPALPAPLRGRALEIVPAAKPRAEAKPEQNAVPPAAPAKASTRPVESRHAVQAKIPKTAAIDVAPSVRPKLVAPMAPTAPDVITAAPSASSPETVMPPHRDSGDLAPERMGQDVREQAAALAKQADQLEAARVEAARVEAAQLAAARLAAEQEAARHEVATLIEAARRAAAQLEAERLLATRQEAARVEAAQLAAARLDAEWEAARQEVATRIEAERRAAAQLEAERVLATRQEAARVEAAHAAQLEAERDAARQDVTARIEAARRAAAQLEAERRLTVRQEAARVEAARTAQPEAQRPEPARQEKAGGEAARPEAERQELARQEPARQEPARQEPARQAAAPQEVARGEAEKEERAREERLRAIGRQLDEEAAQREAASNAARQLPLSLSTARRARLWGRADPNVELVQYAERWALKIQLNTPVTTVREIAKQPHMHPTVTVAIRSDGSVESVTFVVSSGVAQVDEAIRRILKSHEHYPAFPPALSREYDVIEIRRTWHFDDAVRLQ
ncbi:MAG: TonB C-terminal domain-containing protein [Burkholderiaceae bacterium]